jgi:fermentation-respiration switch protein FrsA (DUF1100 family)
MSGLGLITVIALGAGGLVLLASLLFFGACLYFSCAMARPRMFRLEFTRQRALDLGEATPELIARFSERFELDSPYGYVLRGVALGGTDPASGRPSTRTIVLCHGHTWTWYGMLKYLPPFLDRGWNVVMFDSRGHGATKGPPPGFGVFEAADLAAVIAWSRRRFAETATLGLYGESMGAAIVLKALEQGAAADFAVCDCSFSDLADLSRHQLRRSHVPRGLVEPMLAVCRRMILVLAGFDIHDVSPRRWARGRRVPLLILHGEKDGLAPAWMARELHQAAEAAGPEAGPCRLRIFPEAYHAKSWASDPAGYRETVESFLEDVVYHKA